MPPIGIGNIYVKYFHRNWDWCRRYGDIDSFGYLVYEQQRRTTILIHGTV